MQKKTRSIFEELDGIYTERYSKQQERVVHRRKSCQQRYCQCRTSNGTD